ncbi:MAG TPA: branched-chain amino acid ABC transporter permease [Atopostipes sp.]|nr:branched-chain amino acid ABC transporter permease [Atopostipes sp.]
MKVFNRTNVGWIVLIVLTYLILEGLTWAGIIDPFYEITVVNIFINIILAVGLNLVVGFSGQLALGHAGFMAIGAYATGVLLTNMMSTAGFIMSILLGMLLAGILALIVGIPTLRLRGDYFAIATLGASEIIRVAVLNLPEITNGAVGISGIPLIVDWRFAFFAAALTILAVTNYIRSSPGRATISIREDEIAAESLSIKTTYYKNLAFLIGAVTAALAGSIHASYFGVINPGQFTFNKSIDILIIVVFGGIGSVTGSVVAAIVLGVINVYLQQFGALRMIVYALVLILIMIFRPSGLMGNVEFSLSKLLKRPQDVPGSIENMEQEKGA